MRVWEDFEPSKIQASTDMGVNDLIMVKKAAYCVQ